MELINSLDLLGMMKRQHALRHALRDQNPILTLEDYSRPSHEGYRNTIVIPNGNNVVPLRSDTIRLVGGKLHDINAKESWVLLEDLTLYDNKSWNDLRDFAKPVKEISLPQDVPSTSNRRIIELENQVQCLMEAHLAPKSSIQVNKIASSCEICSGPHDTQFSKFEADFIQQQSKITNKIDTFLKAINDQMTGALPSDTVKNPKLRDYSTSPVLSPRSYPTRDVMFIEIVKKYDDPSEEELGGDENNVTRGLKIEYFDIFSTRRELAYHKYLLCGPIPSLFLRNPIIVGGCSSNLKIPCNIGHVHVEKAYIDFNSPLNFITRMLYNWIMRRQLARKDPEGIRGIINFTGRVKGMHIFIGNFTYVSNFMIVEDISSIIDPRLSQVVLGKPFVEMSNMTHDLSLGVVRFTNRIDEITYKMPHKIEQYNSLSDLEKEHTKSVYFKNEEDKKRVDYVMSKILRFYKECLELGPEYLTGLEDEG
ncbi:hypothetical protein Tco_0640145 [Tanacetum coccineum]